MRCAVVTERLSRGGRAAARPWNHLARAGSRRNRGDSEARRSAPPARQLPCLANRHTAMAGAGRAARALGFEVMRPTGRDVPARRGTPGAVSPKPGCPSRAGRPLCVVASGRRRSRCAGTGRGGRNQEFALGAAAIVRDRRRILASIGTDGIDGPTDAAGAIVDATTDARARRCGSLHRGGARRPTTAYPLLAQLGDLVRCGPDRAPMSAMSTSC